MRLGVFFFFFNFLGWLIFAHAWYVFFFFFESGWRTDRRRLMIKGCELARSDCPVKLRGCCFMADYSDAKSSACGLWISVMVACEMSTKEISKKNLCRWCIYIWHSDGLVFNLENSRVLVEVESCIHWWNIMTRLARQMKLAAQTYKWITPTERRKELFLDGTARGTL